MRGTRPSWRRWLRAIGTDIPGPKVRAVNSAYTLWQEAAPSLVPTVPLSISALGFDILIALAQRPGGIGAGPLGRIVDGAPTSVQNTLRMLIANGLVRRTGTRYLVEPGAPGVEELVAAGLRLARPAAALRLVLRANDSVEFASEDPGGFVVGLRSEAEAPVAEALERSIATVRRGRSTGDPAILHFQFEELTRIVRSAVGLRTRLAAADVIKGSVRAAGRSPGVGYPGRTGRIPQIW